MIKKISISIMLLALFVAIPNLLFAQDEDAVRQMAVDQAAPAAASQQYDAETEQRVKQAQEQIKYTSSGLRDPFTLTLPQETTIVESGPMPQFDIEGYIWGSSIPQAIIEGAVYSEGDMVKSAKIVKIDKNGITFLYNGNNYIIK